MRMQGVGLSRFESIEPYEQSGRLEQGGLPHLFGPEFRVVCRLKDNRMLHTVQFIGHTMFRNGISFEKTAAVPSRHESAQTRRSRPCLEARVALGSASVGARSPPPARTTGACASGSHRSCLRPA